MDSEESEWVEVHRVPSLAEAEVVQSLLQGAGVESRLRYDATSRVILGPGSVNPWSMVRVWVRPDERELALQIIEEALESEGEAEEGDEPEG